MNWDAVGAIAELLGAIAVIVSILYLAAQVRQGSADLRASIIHSLHANEVELSSKPSVDGVLASAIDNAHTGRSLTDQERAQYTMFVYASLVSWQQVHFEYQRLGVEEELFGAQTIRLAGLLRPPLARAVWRTLRDRFTDDFNDFIEHIVESQTEHDPAA